MTRGPSLKNNQDQSNHTPGPWKVYGGAYKFVVARPMPNHRPFVCELPDSEPETEEERANANLIAAAPEMYKALKAVAEDRHACQIMKLRALAAIAKAEGRNGEGR